MRRTGGELRDELAAAVAGQVGGERRYPEELKRRAGAYTRARLASGMKRAAVAAELGVPPITLARWAAAVSGFRTVAVEAEETKPTGRRDLVLVSPGGFRLEGLELSEVAALLRVVA